MKRMRILGLALAAVFAVFAITAVGASAAPEYAACLKTEPKNTGNFTDKECKVAAAEPGTGKYELVAGSIGKGKKSKIKGIGTQILHSVVPGTGDVPIECEKLKGSFQPVAPNLQTEVNLEFKKCTTLKKSVPCENVSKGTLKTNTLVGQLAEVEGKVGSILAPTGPYFIEFTCPGPFPKVRVLDQVFGEYTGNTNTISKISTGHYTVNAYLGEPFPGYTPLVNHPTAGPPTFGILHTEVKNEQTEKEQKEACEKEEPCNPEGWGPIGGLPSGQEGEVEVKGEALMIKAP